MLTARNSNVAARRSAALALAGALWIGGVCLGVASLMDQERRPGPETSPGESWPAESALARVPGAPTLVLVAHPKCPCTRSSLDHLREIVARAPRAVKTYVIFTRPDALPPSWSRTSLWDKAAAIPNCTPVDDDGGRETRNFRAATSGQVLLYDERGNLRFAGGITSARGTEGGGAGKASVLACLSTGNAPLARTPVFGCPLDDSISER